MRKFLAELTIVFTSMYHTKTFTERCAITSSISIGRNKTSSPSTGKQFIKISTNLSKQLAFFYLLYQPMPGPAKLQQLNEAAEFVRKQTRLVEGSIAVLLTGSSIWNTYLLFISEEHSTWTSQLSDIKSISLAEIPHFPLVRACRYFHCNFDCKQTLPNLLLDR